MACVWGTVFFLFCHVFVYRASTIDTSRTVVAQLPIEELHLTCTYIQDDPDEIYNLRWERAWKGWSLVLERDSHGVISTGSAFEERVRLGKSCTLIITNVTTDLQGTYTVAIVNHLGEEVSATVKLIIVEEDSRVFSKGLSLSTVPKQTVQLPASQVTIPCACSLRRKNDLVTIEWRYGNRTSKRVILSREGQISYDDQQRFYDRFKLGLHCSLVISNPQSEDHGLYRVYIRSPYYPEETADVRLEIHMENKGFIDSKTGISMGFLSGVLLSVVCVLLYTGCVRYKYHRRKVRSYRQSHEMHETAARSDCSEQDQPLLDAAHLCKIKEELESWYDCTLSKLRPIPWIPFYEMEMDHVYTNLKIISGYKHRLCERGCDTVIGDVEQLADKLWGGEKRTVTFIEGAPGIGKSTLCRRLAYTWATNIGKIHKIPFKLVIFLEARAMQTNFKRCIYQQLLPKGFDLNEEDVYKCLQESQKDCLVIIDGIDELNEKSKSELLDLLHGRVLRKSHVLVTGRPEVSPDYLQFCNNHLRITGFSEENRDSYIHKYFASDQCVPRDKLLLQIWQNRYLEDLTVNPFITMLLCVLAEEGCGDIPLHLHEILKEITRMVCRRYVSSDVHKERTPPSIDGLLSAYRYLAFIGIQSEKLVFQESFIREHYPGDMCEHLLKSGLFNRDYTVSRIHTTGYCYFPHKTIQEFLCCEYLADLTGEEFAERWNSVITSEDMVTTLFNVLGNHPDKFDFLLTHFTPKRAKILSMQFFIGKLTNVQAQNVLVDYIIKSHGHNMNQLPGAWLLEINDRNSYILRGLCDKYRLQPIVFVQAGFSDLIYNGVSVFHKVTPENHWLKVHRSCFKNISVKLPIVICEDIYDASNVLQCSVDSCIGVLTVIKPITVQGFQDVCAFIRRLERDDRSMTVYLCLLFFSGNDMNDYTKLNILRLIESTKCQKTRLHVDVKNLLVCDLKSSGNSRRLWHTTIRLIKPLLPHHHMYYEKYCPY